MSSQMECINQSEPFTPVCDVEDLNSIMEMFHIDESLVQVELSPKFSTCKHISSIYFADKFHKQNAYEILENMFKYFSRLVDVISNKLTAIQDIGNDELFELLNVKISLIECIKSVLKFLCKSDSTNKEMKLVTMPTLHVITKAYEHYKNSAVTYGDRFNIIIDLLQKLFPEVCSVQMALYQYILKLKFSSDSINQTDKLFLSKVFRKILHMSYIIAELDKKSLNYTWRFMIGCMYNFKSVFEEMPEMEEYIQFLCSQVISNMKSCVDIFQTEQYNPDCISAKEQIRKSYKQAHFFSRALSLFLDVASPTKSGAKLFLEFLLELFVTLTPIIKVPKEDQNIELRASILGQILSEQSDCLSLMLEVNGTCENTLELDFPNEFVKFLTWIFIIQSQKSDVPTQIIPVFDKNNHTNMIEKIVQSYVIAFPHIEDMTCMKLFESATDQLTLSSFHDVTIQQIYTMLKYCTEEQLTDVLCYFVEYFDKNYPVEASLAFDVITGLSISNPEDIGLYILEQALNVLQSTCAGSKQMLLPVYLHFCRIIEKILPAFNLHQLQNVNTNSTQDRSLADCYMYCINLFISKNPVEKMNVLVGQLNHELAKFQNIKNIKDLHNLIFLLSQFEATLSILDIYNKSSLTASGVVSVCKKVYTNLSKTEIPKLAQILCNFLNYIVSNLNQEFISSIVVYDCLILVFQIILTIPEGFYTNLLVETVLSTSEHVYETFKEEVFKIFICELLSKFSSNQLSCNAERSMVKLFSNLLISDNFYIQQCALKSFENFSKNIPNAHIIKECVKNAEVQNKVRNYLQKIVERPLNHQERVETLKIQITQTKDLPKIYENFLYSHKVNEDSHVVNRNEAEQMNHTKLVVENFNRATYELSKFMKTSGTDKLPPDLRSKIISTVDVAKKLI